jgi:hypothetical protein
MKSEFQQRFKINDEFYTGQQIRDAIAECFPFKEGGYQGLARIVFLGKPTHADQRLDLTNEIPDIMPTDSRPSTSARNYCYGVIEGEVRGDRVQAASFFVPTDLGYICDEMQIRGWKVSSEKEATHIERAFR